MRRWNRWAEDAGTASLEFIAAGVVLLVPLVYLVIAVSAVQGGALAVEGASRQAARVFVQAATIEEARASAELAVQFALADYGLDTADVSLAITCRPHPDACLTRRGFVTIVVETRVPMPLTPPMLHLSAPPGVPLSSTATQQVSRFSSAEQ